MRHSLVKCKRNAAILEPGSAFSKFYVIMSSLPQVSEEIYNSFSKTAENIMMYFDKKEQEKELVNLREIVKQHSLVNAKLKKVHEITERFSTLHNNDDEEEENKQEISEEETLNDFKKQMSNIKPQVSKDKNLLEYDRQVEALRQDMNKETNKEENDSDEELQLTSSVINVTDPITKKRMTDPVKNVVCGHVYERESVIEMLKVNKNTKCPIGGCKNKQYLTLKDLQTDIVLRTYLKKHLA